jgi:predicted enzyme related to lactoylglutathione lyase
MDMSNYEIVHIEFSARDPKGLGKFYNALFGWEVEFSEELDYVMFDGGDGPGGGFPRVGEGMKAGTVMVYISTDDIDTSLSRAESLGAKILTPKTEIPMTGWFGTFADPTGNVVGVFQTLQND